MKKLMLIMLSGLTVFLLLQVLGCEGKAGNRGTGGDPGDPGDPYAAPIPENRFYSLAVGNNSPLVHNGAPKVYLAFDEKHANAGDTVVCQHLTGMTVPEVDGIDGSGEWPAKYTDLTLRKMALHTNKIEVARVRAAFDELYIYFQVKWTEVADSAFGLAVEENLYPGHWLYQDTSSRRDSVWRRELVGNEDRVMFMFEITPMTWYDHDGCLVTCHAGGENIDMPGSNFHSTRNNRARMDLWSWSSISTNPVGFADDKYMDGTGQILDRSALLGYVDGIKGDLGRATTFPNLQFDSRTINGVLTTVLNRPLYMQLTDPDTLATYPMWDWQMTVYASSTSWRLNYRVPLFVTAVPTLSRADIVARGQYDNGTWTVEFKRLRVTGNGDDAQF